MFYTPNRSFKVHKGIQYSLYTNKDKYYIGEKVVMTLGKYNLTNQDKIFKYNTSQYYDFIIKKDGKIIWKWSEGKYFLQAVQYKLLKPGQNYSVTEEWKINQNLVTGIYHVEGINLANPQIKLEVAVKIIDNDR